MEIILSKYCDFCNGVKKTIDISKNGLKQVECVYSLGQVIHNSQVIDELEKKGLCVVDDISDIPDGSYMIIRSHGISETSLKRAAKKNIKLIDAACSFVKYIQNICKELKQENYFVIITGDKNHPEVEALKNIAGNGSIIVSNPEENLQFPDDLKKVAVISQSTYTREDFYNIISKILAFHFSEVRIYNTICLDSIRRREEIKKLAQKSDVVIVIGGKNSANTKRLVEISKIHNPSSFHLNNISDVDCILDKIKSSDKIGIIGGASTPKWLVEDFIKYITDMSKTS